MSSAAIGRPVGACGRPRSPAPAVSGCLADMRALSFYTASGCHCLPFLSDLHSILAGIAVTFSRNESVARDVRVLEAERRRGAEVRFLQACKGSVALSFQKKRHRVC